jgi:hypothetical protein
VLGLGDRQELQPKGECNRVLVAWAGSRFREGLGSLTAERRDLERAFWRDARISRVRNIGTALRYQDVERRSGDGAKVAVALALFWPRGLYWWWKGPQERRGQQSERVMTQAVRRRSTCCRTRRLA